MGIIVQNNNPGIYRELIPQVIIYSIKSDNYDDPKIKQSFLT